VSAFLLSFALIFVAEIGDKSQLMAMAFAARYPFRTVLAGITTATALVHLVSVGVGATVGENLPTALVDGAAGVAFLLFGLWTLRGDTLSEEEAERARRSARSALLAVAVTFLLAELGDKTMLATITLATDRDWFGTWLGSTVGMVCADALAVVLGAALARFLPPAVVRVGAAVLFFLFGALLIAQGVTA
jgi:putative Ca2+/H+ antiporter (TMEM165/GDT1 family)